MKKLLILLIFALAFSVNTYAAESTSVVKKNHTEDPELKFTIDLYNITKYSTENLAARINRLTKNFLTKEDFKYLITIKASLDPEPKKTETLDIRAISFKIEIKGTLEEVKKELENIGLTIDEMRK